MELQRATLVAEQSHDQDKIIALMEDKVSLLEEALKLKATINEMAQYISDNIEGLDKIKSKRHDDDLDDYDGPDDVDVERMQSTADHDSEAMPNG